MEERSSTEWVGVIRVCVGVVPIHTYIYITETWRKRVCMYRDKGDLVLTETLEVRVRVL